MAEVAVERMLLTLVDDLFFAAQIERVARAVGLTPLDHRDEALADPRLALVILDLGQRRPGWSTLLADVRARRPDVAVLAFGPHVDKDTRQAARAQGATLVVTNREMMAKLPDLLRRATAGTLAQTQLEEE